MSAVEVSHLSFSYDGQNDVIKDVSFEIPKGSYTTIVGHNGSGKSTIAKLLIGLLKAKSGEIKILGNTLNEENVYSLRNHVGIVFQNPDNQFIGSTVADDIAFGLENHCVPQEQMQAIIEDVAARVNMSNFLDSEPTKLSGGQKQRLSIARAIIKKPEIYIFDDSFSALDFKTDAALREELMKSCKKTGSTVLLVAQRISSILHADQIIVLDEGRMVGKGTHQELIKSCRIYQEIASSQLSKEELANV